MENPLPLHSSGNEKLHWVIRPTTEVCSMQRLVTLSQSIDSNLHFAFTSFSWPLFFSQSTDLGHCHIYLFGGSRHSDQAWLCLALLLALLAKLSMVDHRVTQTHTTAQQYRLTLLNVNLGPG